MPIINLNNLIHLLMIGLLIYSPMSVFANCNMYEMQHSNESKQKLPKTYNNKHCHDQDLAQLSLHQRTGSQPPSNQIEPSQSINKLVKIAHVNESINTCDNSCSDCAHCSAVILIEYDSYAPGSVKTYQYHTADLSEVHIVISTPPPIHSRT